MALNSFSAILSNARSSFNILKEWRNLKEDQDRQSNSILQNNDDDIRQTERKNRETQGEKISSAGTSGIDISSFNDALLSADLKNIREKYEKQQQAEEKIRELKSKSSADRKSKKDKLFSYSVKLLSDLNGWGF